MKKKGGRLRRPPRDTPMEFFEKYKSQDVGPTRARLAELITIFESDRQAMTIRELQELRAEIDKLTERLRVEREAL